MKHFLFFVFLVVFFSCKKADTDCYICTTTHVTTTSVPAAGYPKTTIGSVLELCDTREGIETYVNVNQGTSSRTNQQGIVITDTYSTECVLK